LSDELMGMSELYGIGKTTKAALLISTGETRVRELLETSSIYITDKSTGELSKEVEKIIRDLNKALKERTKDRYRENIRKFEIMLEKHPDSGHELQFLLFIGAYYRFIGDYEKAIGTFGKVLDKDPDSDLASIARCAMGIIYEEKLNDHNNAARMYRKVLEDYPSSPETSEATKGLRRMMK
jgi:tetratricopeptide (TPR) repeat protein